MLRCLSLLAVAALCWLALLVSRRESIAVPRMFWPLAAYAGLTLLSALDYYFLRGGIGNDYDPIMFYDREAAETLARAILPLLDSPDVALSRKALRAVAVVREARDRDVLLGVMRKLASPDKSTREIAEQELSRFPAEYASQSRSGSTPSGGSR